MLPYKGKWDRILLNSAASGHTLADILQVRRTDRDGRFRLWKMIKETARAHHDTSQQESTVLFTQVRVYRSLHLRTRIETHHS